MPRRVISLTALALAPGVLKTTTPAWEHLSTGMLLVPAPALAMALRLGGSSISWREAERTMMPSGASASLPQRNFCLSKISMPTGLILFSVWMVYMLSSPPVPWAQALSASNFFIKSTRARTPSVGMAL